MKRKSLPVRRKPVRKVRACRAPHPGQKCPRCRKGVLDYDGLLQLTCSACGHLAGSGGFS